jgi:hypothetical protein
MISEYPQTHPRSPVSSPPISSIRFGDRDASSAVGAGSDTRRNCRLHGKSSASSTTLSRLTEGRRGSLSWVAPSSASGATPRPSRCGGEGLSPTRLRGLVPRATPPYAVGPDLRVGCCPQDHAGARISRDDPGNVSKRADRGAPAGFRGETGRSLHLGTHGPRRERIAG